MNIGNAAILCGHVKPTKTILTVREAAKLIGISQITLYKWIEHGIIPAEILFRPNSRVYLKNPAIFEWIKSYGVGSKNKSGE